MEKLKPCTCGEMPKQAWDCRLSTTGHCYICYKCGKRSASMIHREDAITAWNEGLSESLPYKNIEDARRDEEHRKSRNRKEQ